MQFTIHREGKGFLIVGASSANNTLHVTDLSDLLRLRQRINAFIDDQTDDGAVALAYTPNRRIGVTSALELAVVQGIELKSNTLLAAARRGSIVDAVKEGSRWTFPLWAFEEWLTRHTQRADYTPADEDSD